MAQSSDCACCCNRSVSKKTFFLNVPGAFCGKNWRLWIGLRHREAHMSRSPQVYLCVINPRTSNSSIQPSIYSIEPPPCVPLCSALQVANVLTPKEVFRRCVWAFVCLPFYYAPLMAGINHGCVKWAQVDSVQEGSAFLFLTLDAIVCWTDRNWISFLGVSLLAEEMTNGCND